MAPHALLQRLLELSREFYEDEEREHWEPTARSRASGLSLYRRAPTNRRHRWFQRRNADGHFRIDGECVGEPHDALDALVETSPKAFQALAAFASDRKLDATFVEASVGSAGARRVQLARAHHRFHRYDDGPEHWIIHADKAPLAIEAAVYYILFERAGNSGAQWFGVLLREHGPGIVRVFGAGYDPRIASGGSWGPQLVVRLLQFGEAMRLRRAVAEAQVARSHPTQPATALAICTICHVDETHRPWWSWPREFESCDVCHRRVCTSCAATMRLIATDLDDHGRPFVWATCCKTCVVAMHRFSTASCSLSRDGNSLHTSSTWYRPGWRATNRSQERKCPSPVSSRRPKWSVPQLEDDETFLESLGRHSNAGTASTTTTDSTTSFLAPGAAFHSRHSDDDDAIPMLEDAGDLAFEDLAAPERATEMATISLE